MSTRNEKEINERRLAHDIRTALDASANALPDNVTDRLAAARRIALSRKKAQAAVAVPQLASAGMPTLSFDEDDSALHRAGSWLRRLGLVWTLVALAAGLAGIYHWQQQKRVDELADVDAAMLLDDLPPTAYADQGFHVFLKRGQ
ncbi:MULTISPECIES: DUF3619 family protein [Cupriavidus]|uniref:DUF3619 family protein n=1 Tax=Cupriavidus basilensis TaxID=68895 RepID=A0A643G201_9BURK|nr:MULTISPECIES: DUF3619 family protein [Cupriavidus]MBB1632307.1 hypothetical protein [Cupriavidus sp. UME77]MDR3384682.1 DUF3619 family protein [Cupriavidus basilensis]QOT77538.1 DUF3619 family protein [Cupriavidus basilensis]